MSASYRKLSAEEIKVLENNGCSCQSWNNIKVDPAFDCSRIKNTNFSGNVTLGKFDKNIQFDGGIIRATGIKNATIHNCQIHNNVYINNVRNYIANYIIEDDVIIEDIDLLAVESQSSFGNGTEAVVLNETGGREIPIYDRLTAQIAYIIAFYRHRTELIKNLQKMIADYTASATSDIGIIAKNAKLINCRIIKNLKVGQDCTIEGASRLENGSLNSCAADPIYIGHDVIAKDFIVASGSKINDGTILEKCFIGQGCELSKQYSAENSVFFANCAGFHGEACAIFAGPYTVTHHKSTLLIAGLFSFLNAGSGSNQSNHMYKLGPIHQGVVERGSKTTSDSYMLWPAKVGAFTVVMGRHYRNSDTSDLPFSYMIESEDESILVPAVNLRSVGTIRDARKWPKRDKRKDADKLDCINFNLLSPYTIQKMLNGSELLKKLAKTSGNTSEYFTYHSVKIKNSSLYKGINLYQMGINKFLGNSLIKRLEEIPFKTDAEIQNRLKPNSQTGLGKWIDIAGLFAPQQSVNDLLDKIENKKIKSLEEIKDAFWDMHKNYYTCEWTWAIDVLQKQLNKSIDKITAKDIAQIVNQWKDSVIALDNMLAADASKEFSDVSQTSFGLDGDENTKTQDFLQVRGDYETNSFVCEIKKHIEAKSALGNELLQRIKHLC